ncbi:cytochrome c oxidase subunit 3 family protein [Azospirillum brasilense]|uniref:Cytochrome c oxidase subunit 3 family protein n=1 Tax=Azospirillum brasilense TaxID=192 RepID=A0A0P0FGP2_AZOBR|nr:MULTISPECIES: cytochrome c oxidase subunit 3 family protein [Azospirillum]ALJ38966.1 copper oxidase [Azospirillum brasilense]MDW7557821.1 cytochrome c oxidase subunit 3 family protein [Azospirillum brasilense]MDW7596333.1 cytochrome c oxidase subunit 3 family protein [Azospirillum brasilense]MDW7631790.1 cytochrome c oxidase subunit 3 family protein [Azospirillum brasilense]MDX5950630.1 cytochrome c oxidase subunit 3 family protein [Azospirillum brasilense]
MTETAAPATVVIAEDVADGEAADWGPLSSLPGNPMMWILILGELAAFGAMFIGFAVTRALDPATFDASQAQLDRLLGGVNTMVLVTSGWLVAVALRRRASGLSHRPLMLGAMALGGVFLAIKAVEYGDKIGRGLTLETNSFFQLYYLLTGFHAMHVAAGIVILGIVTWWDSLENLETGAAFWHMVDLIWVLLYPIVYLLR